jgi:hypothetical protein
VTEDDAKALQQRSHIAQTLDVRFNWRQSTYPLAYARSERVKRSLVCTSSGLRSLRPCWTIFFIILFPVEVMAMTSLLFTSTVKLVIKAML